MPPDLLALADGLRSKFGARLTYLETPTLTRGDPAHLAPGITPVEGKSRMTIPPKLHTIGNRYNDSTNRET